MYSIDAVFDSPLPSAPLAEFRNLTPFPSHYFQTVDPGDRVYHVGVVRVTYNLRRVENDGTLSFADDQTPLATADEYYGEVNQSSVKWESDFAPYKPKCDVLLANAVAVSPEGKPRDRWPVGVQVGDWRKVLMVTGPRQLERTRGSYQLSEPEPAVEVPLLYEYACGGETRFPEVCPVGEDPQRWTPDVWEVDERNPVGCGFRPRAWLKRAKPASVAAPQVELFDRPYTGESDYPVCGFGVIARPWLPRRLLAGTYDQAWKESRWPGLPVDHDYAYWNGAPADQQIPYPEGGEIIRLHNLHESSLVEFALPLHRFYSLVRLDAGPMLPRPLNLDTLVFDLEAFRLMAVYRAVVAAEAGVRVIEARLQQQWPEE